MRRTALRYGSQHAQLADLWWPDGPQGDLPVVALIHGGFWRQIYTKRLMHPLAKALVTHGWAVCNVEYRRVGLGGSGGWPATFDDVSAALNALATVDGLDLTRVLTCGHSAGGHLALWLAGMRTTSSSPEPGAQPVRVRAAISLAGVADLDVAARTHLGGGAAVALMGGSPDDLPDVYRLGSPAAQLPLGVPQHLIHGLDDATVPPSMSAEYVERAVASGDDAVFVPVAGAGHMDMIKPGGRAAAEILAVLDRF
ncbi:MAG TPA: alpha/beta hydrolase [Acidimicrobiales bacterium]|nr:alpha/beta hydrolase [Acidimicrobiales bacterium]